MKENSRLSLNPPRIDRVLQYLPKPQEKYNSVGGVESYTHRGDKRFLSLWLTQCGICAIYHQKITHDMQWSPHHINRTVKRGSHNVSNLRLTHSHCHNNVHSRKLEGVEPVADRQIIKVVRRVSRN